MPSLSRNTAATNVRWDGVEIDQLRRRFALRPDEPDGTRFERYALLDRERTPALHWGRRDGMAPPALARVASAREAAG